MDEIESNENFSLMSLLKFSPKMTTSVLIMEKSPFSSVTIEKWFQNSIKVKISHIVWPNELLNISFEHTYKNYRVLNIQINVTLSCFFVFPFFLTNFYWDKKIFYHQIRISQLKTIPINSMEDSSSATKCWLSRHA